MTLTIIAGTHSFIDLSGNFRRALARSAQSLSRYNINGVKFKKRRFERVLITKEGEVIPQPSRILPIGGSGLYWTVSQPTGSCKTILAAHQLYMTWLNGGNIAANFSFKWMPHNIGQPKEKWTPNVTTLEDVMEAKNTRLTIDDIKSTIERWQAKEADIISMSANLGRKESVDLDITSQGVTNYVPPNIRRIATGYEIPYCTIRDQRIPSPDGKGFPHEVEIISLIPGDTNVGDVFVGFGFLHGDIPDGRLFKPTQELLDSYKTMEVSIGLKVGKECAEASNAPGWGLECKAKEFLESVWPGIEVQHLKKKIFDLYTPTHVFDVIGKDEDGNGYCEQKTWSKHLGSARRTGKIPYLMFEWGGSWAVIRIKPDLPEGQRLNFSDSSIYNRIRTIDSITHVGVPIPQTVSTT